MDNPLDILQQWWLRATTHSPLQQQSAICVSTVDADGFPDGRFVDLKAVTDEHLMFCTSYVSQKGNHIALNNKIAITIWWDHVGYQIRIKGRAEKISNRLADSYWQSRTDGAKLATLALQQSRAIDDTDEVTHRVNQTKVQYVGELPRPDSWGGYQVAPVAMEFLTFQENRLHLREHYDKRDNIWHKTLLQP